MFRTSYSYLLVQHRKMKGILICQYRSLHVSSVHTFLSALRQAHHGSSGSNHSWRHIPWPTEHKSIPSGSPSWNPGNGKICTFIGWIIYPYLPISIHRHFPAQKRLPDCHAPGQGTKSCTNPRPQALVPTCASRKKTAAQVKPCTS